MTDPIDRASSREDELRADALAVQRRRSGMDGKTVADSAECCAACGEAIPEARRRALPGVQTCIDCQTEIERAGLRIFQERTA